jgi:hypothetical protein
MQNIKKGGLGRPFAFVPPNHPDRKWRERGEF